MFRFLIVLTIAAGVWHFGWSEPAAVQLGPGIHANVLPAQSATASGDSFDYKGYRITPLADFSIRAKVLSREDYSFGREADVSPMDLALGWGPMSDEQVLSDIAISQSGRWYRWSTPNLPIPRRDIETHSANMHMIPASDDVADALDDFRQGQIIQLEGYLVRVDGDDGWRWISSLTREDTGARACEVVYVKRARVTL
ncbi:hypothetical protein [Thiosocius teredinicola]|uniref:hypothetical protein n=1 Tax=Thiosocius teredinicola TaxID=1973002 RepID=UPI000990B387